MIDEREVREMLHRRADTVPATPVGTPTAVRRARRRLVLNGAMATVAAAIIAVATFAGVDAIRSGPVPADPPSEELGIFAPVAGRIVYENEGIDRGYAPGVWAVDPNGPSDTTEGLRVADDVASTLVPLSLDDATPLGWSSDGTELLFKRSDGAQFPEEHLYILHADGSETRLNSDPMYFGGATISPDGTRVVFAAWGDDLGMYVVDAEGGRPIPLPLPGAKGIVMAPNFSPDGTQIAYLDSGDSESHMWVMDADGSNAREILVDEETLIGGTSGPVWSPSGDRIAIGLGDYEGSDGLTIYTFAPDGSDFTKVIDGGISPYWSPDGSQIAFTIPCDEHPNASCPEGSLRRAQFDLGQQGGNPAGLAIADADGTNVQAFGFAASGPWHPAASPPAIETAPIPTESFARANGEVLSFDGLVTFAGTPWDRSGDLGAVGPETGEERVLVPDLDKVVSAEWSADGRWVAYETHDGNDIGLWVVGASQEPRLIATGGYLFADGSVGWAWSATGADLLWARRAAGSDANVIERSQLHRLDVETGETVGLGTVDGDVGLDHAWSPDGTRIAYASGDGEVFSVDMARGEPSLLARFPDMDLDPGVAIRWSPDGTHISVVNDMGDAGERLYVMGADGSNLRLLADSDDLLLVSWSPDGRLAFAEGSQADGDVRIRVAPIDGSDPLEIGSVPFGGCTYNYMCGVTWSPDASAIGFHKDGGGDSAIAADGSGEPEPLDDLTYMSWAGGRFGEG